MTQFSSGSFASTSLFGAARGYVGSTTYGKLMAGLRDTPDAVVLLDPKPLYVRNFIIPVIHSG
jgi:ATP-dependent Clp protease ATP-binding subunit ClpA